MTRTAANANPEAVYPPAPREHDFGNGVTVTLPTPDTALLRLTEYLNQRLGFTEDGYRNPTDDPFLADLALVLTQASTAIGTLEVMTTGAFASTADKPVYAGGVVSEGNRIYTPQEAACNAMEQIREFEKRSIRA